jgi:hypothetical protein
MTPATGEISGTPTTSGTASVVLTVTDAAGATATRTLSLTIAPGASVSSTSPSSLGQGASGRVVAVNGSGFVAGGGLAVAFSGGGITVNSTTFVSTTQVDADVSVAPGAATGARDVTLTNGDGSTSTGSGVFTVNPAPTVTSVLPPAAAANSSGVPVNLSGAGFAPGAVVTFVGGGAPTVTNTVVNDSGTITVTIDTNSSGTYDVVVSNPDGGQATVAGGFTVT